jgi:hypothetical protein
LETEILLALKFKYLPETKANTLLQQSNELGRILSGLIAPLLERLGQSTIAIHRP